MTAFDRIESGIPALDEMLDSIRLGDNVVWQLSRLEDFAHFTRPFVKQALVDGRAVHYIRFARHAPLLDEYLGITVHELDSSLGFETFTLQVHRIIEEAGQDAFYVFDCLSDLLTMWSSDLMMGNFFRLTCPYLFSLDTVAYFPIISGKHSFAAIAKIRDTTQLLLDVSDTDNEGELFIHPLKVWNRYSESMFLTHSFWTETTELKTLTSGVDMNRFYDRKNKIGALAPDRNIDSWDRFFMQARTHYLDGTLWNRTCKRMCEMMMTKDPRMRSMIETYFDAADYLEVRDHMVGTGIVGGKTAGMLLARKIVEKKLPGIAQHLEAHDSFYVGTDVFYTYIVYNDLWPLRVAQQAEGQFIDAAPALQKGIRDGSFPEDIEVAFRRVLDHFGQVPIIVRSSSFLEDGFGNAFAGKYESVFCPNIGTLENRLTAFEDAVRRVYASTLDASALEYRIRSGLDESEEQMALLVQRVSGSRYGTSCFMPTAAGVGYSHSSYCWMPNMDPRAGMLRLVMGLGTKAVDRTGSDYPRIVSLDRPEATTATTSAERHRYCQRYANFIDLDAQTFAELPCAELADLMSASGFSAVFEHDREAEMRLRERGQRAPVVFASCAGLVKNSTFTDMMRSIMHELQEAYACPVDIEYAINVDSNDRFIVNLLQCRPLQEPTKTHAIMLPDIPDASDRLLFHIRDCAMGKARAARIDAVVSVDPQRYYACSHAKKSLIASLIGNANTFFGKENASWLLLVPGRVGTSSPELGVPVNFADISTLSALCEVAYSGAGYSPELSYGSHMFQDLVECGIFYGGIHEDRRRIAYAPEMLASLPDCTELACGNIADSDLAGIIRVSDTREAGLTLWHDESGNETICACAE